MFLVGIDHVDLSKMWEIWVHKDEGFANQKIKIAEAFQIDASVEYES